MAANRQTTDSGPVRESRRITSLDLIRGIAVLGILLMNAVNFGLGGAPYFNLSAGGSETWLDWTIGVFGEVFVDQKFMGLFSMLFGAGMILFIDRASQKGRRAVLLNLWRNGLLLVIGIVHVIAWEGGVLVAYALASVFLIAMRKLPNRALITIGVVVFMLSILCALWAQNLADTGASLSGLWTSGEVADDEVIVIPFLLGYFLRALGLILVGAGLYRAGFMNGGIARQHISEDGAGRASHWPVSSRAGGNHHRSERLLQRDCLHQPDSEYDWIDSRFARIHEPDYSLEQRCRQPDQATPTRGRQNGADKLPDADGPGAGRIGGPAIRCRLCEPERCVGICDCCVGAADVVVAGMAESFPLWAGGVALASSDLSESAAASSSYYDEPSCVVGRQVLESVKLPRCKKNG